MKAGEKKVIKFLSESDTRFVIPVYQRNYDWTFAHCKRLLDDIIEVGGNSGQSAHFIGSIVYISDDESITSEVTELTIVDGQQRLTTITLIYLTIYWLAKSLNDEPLVKKIFGTYLINEHVAVEEKLKLRPTENNDKALKYLLRGDANEEFSGYSKLINNFNYFKDRICKENYQIVLVGLSKLMFVVIGLNRQNDDPQRIFESLNSTGLDLSQADLIRNYILMGLNSIDQNNIYQHYWEDIEQLAKDESSNSDRVPDFIRDFLTFKNKQIPNKGNVYLEFKKKYPITTRDELEQNLSIIKGFAKHYNKLINPKREHDDDIRLQLEYINQLEINVAYPFLMNVYDDFDKSNIDKQTFIDVLELVQSFAWRRSIVGLPTNALNKIFMTLYDKVDIAEYLMSIQEYLTKRLGGRQRFPKNTEVIDALRVKDVYNINHKNKMYLLERLENFGNKEKVIIYGNTDITVEHIFPQHPDDTWKSEIGDEDFAFIRDNFLNTIGNLTLSGYNGNLGNKSFVEKRDMENVGYKYSRLWLNRYLASLDCWNKNAIEKRFDMIMERFIQIWEYPKISIETTSDNEEINIFDAGEPTDKKVEYMIFCGEKITKVPISAYYAEIFKKLFELSPELFFNTDLGNRIRLSKCGVDPNLRGPLSISDTYVIEGHGSSKALFDKIKRALTIFELEDDLIIKYAE